MLRPKIKRNLALEVLESRLTPSANVWIGTADLLNKGQLGTTKELLVANAVKVETDGSTLTVQVAGATPDALLNPIDFKIGLDDDMNQGRTPVLGATSAQFNYSITGKDSIDVRNASSSAEIDNKLWEVRMEGLPSYTWDSTNKVLTLNIKDSSGTDFSSYPFVNIHFNGTFNGKSYSLTSFVNMQKVTADVKIEKATVDAADELNSVSSYFPVTGTVPTIIAGESIAWLYKVTNTSVGNVPLVNVVIEDDNGPNDSFYLNFANGYVSGDANGNQKLDTGETWYFKKVDTAIVGPYTNKAKVSGDFVFVNTTTVSDTTESSYFGAEPKVTLDKKTNDLDDAGDLAVGASVAWTYFVTNTGNVPIAKNNVIVKDNAGTESSIDDFFANYLNGDDGDNILNIGETWKFIANGTAILGPYTNLGTAVATFLDDKNHSKDAIATDASSYIGVQYNQPEPPRTPEQPPETPKDYNFTTYTIGGWGGPTTGTPGKYLNDHFADLQGNLVIEAQSYYGSRVPGFKESAFNNGVWTFSSAKSVMDNLPESFTGPQTPDVIIAQLIAIKLSVAFDSVNADFSPSAGSLESLKVSDVTSVLYGKTVAEVISLTQDFLKNGTLLDGLDYQTTKATLNNVLMKMNECFDNGNGTYTGYLV